MFEISEESDKLVEAHLDATFAAKNLDGSEPEAFNICRNTYLSQYRHREEALHDQHERDQNNPNSDYIAAQLRLVATKVDQVQNDLPSSPCAALFPWPSTKVGKPPKFDHIKSYQNQKHPQTRCF